MATNGYDPREDMTQEELERYYRTQQMPRIPGAPTYMSGDTLPTVQQPSTLARSLQNRAGYLEQKLSPPPKEGWGRVGQVLGTIGQDIGAAVAPQVMANIPGTTLNRRQELQRTRQELGEEQQREAIRQEAAQRTGIEQGRLGVEQQRADIEAKKAGLPQLLKGEEYIRRPKGGGAQEYGYEVPGVGVVYAPEGQLPQVQQPQPAGAPAAPPAAPQKPAVEYEYGKPKTLTSEQDLKEKFFAAAAVEPAKRTDDQNQIYNAHVGEWGKLVPATQADINAAIQTMHDRYEQFRKTIGASTPHPPGMKFGESSEDIEKKQVAYDKLLADEVDRKQRELDAQPGKDLATQLQQERLDKMKRDQDTEAFVGYGNLYAQDNYFKAMQSWHKSPSYVKDLGFINSIINDAKTNLPNGPGMNTTTGALVGSAVGGPAGGAIGAVVGGAYGNASGIFSSVINPIANGYLEAARKRGISKEGYDAMQAYFNALPGRMAYELSTQGLKASTLRSSQLLAKVMQTVPSPDTPRDVFPRAFSQYYNPMKALTDHKYKREGFTPPAYKDIYGEEAGGGGAGGHTFTYKGHPFVGVSDEMYNKYKGKPGFEEK